MPDLMNAINVLTPGIKADFQDQYLSTWKANIAQYADFVDFARPADGAYMIYGAWKSAPHATRWPRGTPRGAKGMDAVQYQIVIHDFKNGVVAHENDVADARIDAKRAAMQAGENAARVPVKIFYQIDGAVTNPLLLPSIPNAPDGAALFSATDGTGAARFGVTGGNIVTGTTVANPVQIQAAYAAAIVRAKGFLDSEGEPFYDDSLESKGITIVAGIDNYYNLKKAFEQDRTVVLLSATGAEGVGAAGVAATNQTNPIKDLGITPVRLITNPYKTGNSWSIYFGAAPVKPVFQAIREGLQYVEANRFNNSDCLEMKLVKWLWDWREGWGVNLPIGAVKVEVS